MMKFLRFAKLVNVSYRVLKKGNKWHWKFEKHVKCKSMYLIGTYQRSAIMLNLSAKSEYVQLRGESKMTPLPKSCLIQGHLK